MNYELLINIIYDLFKINAKKALQLQKLLFSYSSNGNQAKKNEIKKKIKDIITDLLYSCLSVDSKTNIYQLGVEINDISYNLECSSNDGLRIGYYGAIRVLNRNDELVITNFIPRSYSRGFYLDPPKDMPDEARKKERDFFNKNKFELYYLGTIMDKREEYVSSKFEVKNDTISRDFVMKLIDYLNLNKIDSEEDFKEEIRQKIKS